MAQATPFQKEAWTEYAIGVIILLLRIFARVKVVGFRNWQGDDYFAIIALLFWTAELTMLEMIGQYGTNIGLSDDQRAALTVGETLGLQIGSKCLLAGWTCYVTLIWSLKACMLFFYNRVTLGLTQQKVVKFCAGLCAATYTAVILTIFLHCRPLHKNWQVYPDPGVNCSADYVNYIVIAVTNVSTDALLVSIPIPLLAKVRLTLRRKLLIGVLLCGGVFVMVATLLRCILSLQSIDSINTSTIWAIRETFVAIISVNAPCIKPLFSSSIWLGSSKDPSSKNRAASYSLSVFGKSKPSQLASTNTYHGERGSGEFILQEPSHGHAFMGGEGASMSDEEAARKGGIQVTTQYEVRRDVD
ncbi:hypothetical protein ASPWEDRAFT_46459 [Aspergillus wentii DTO 134E9]|uniref:Rhodopsin domain-containing protein n=1 Tax=Aspergillus wentii DTO 134E9 TaxID=1073089 RepID=A0A1L9R464_ASPWE|nr:uncharacterized protein ASPWEDRAFT_46459 [Aspergillus wentii DTO 134E9]KAI9927001.1 hypothetical protein MW887_003382 [Aspergillus wentii]OJJ29715.1 hypothetical protein ASPWEDRAFT_46459 [Aspergillus wentii DTO 134E9]